MTAEAPPALPGALADRLRPERVLGRGSFGTVVLARDQAGAPVAVKLLDPQVVASPSLRARFEREVRAGQRLRSDHVVELLDGGIDGETAYLVLQFIDGQDLEELCRSRGGQLPAAEAEAIVEQVLRGLEDLHGAGLAHRDLKPANLLVDAGGRVLLADLGLVRGAADETLTKTGQLLGTPLYMPPEQMRGEKVGPEADVYSLGAIYYELLVGRPPFDGPQLGDILAAKEAGLATGPRAERVEVAPGVDRLLRSWLSPDPARRPPDAAALRAAWERARTGTESGADGTLHAPSPTPAAAATQVVPTPGKQDATTVGLAPGGASPVAVRAEASASPPVASGPAPAGRGRAVAFLLLGIVGLVVGSWIRRSDSAPTRPPLSPEGRRHLATLREGVVAPAIDEAVHLAGADRDDEVQAVWSAGLDAFDELLRGDAARALAEELSRVRLTQEEAEDLGVVILRRRLLANYLDASGAFGHRPSVVASQLEEAYSRVLRVTRLKGLDVQSWGESRDRPPEETWAWSLGGAARRARERAVVEELGGAWRLVRRWDRDFQRYDFDHPTNRRPRLCKLAMSGARFEDASANVPDIFHFGTRKSDHEVLRRQDPRRVDIALAEPGGRPLVLAGTMVRWNPTIQGLLTLVGERDRLALPFSVPPAGQGTADEPGQELHVGILIAVDAVVLPAGLREARVEAFGLQPIGTIDQIVQVCEFYQQVSGSLPAPLVEGPHG